MSKIYYTDTPENIAHDHDILEDGSHVSNLDYIYFWLRDRTEVIEITADGQITYVKFEV